MRTVKVFEYHKVEGKSHFEKVEIGTAKFHQFGFDYEEFETGPGNYSTAIIEYDNGEVGNVHVDLIQFID